MTIRDIVVEQRRRESRLEPVRDFTPAVLLFVDSVDGDAKAEGFDDQVWASEFNQPESAFRIVNRRTPPVVGLQVKIGFPEKPPFLRQVLGIYDEIASLSGYEEGAGGALNSQPHAQAHQYPSESDIGVDPVLIYQAALQLLKCTGDGLTLIVTVQQLVSYRYLDVHRSFAGETVDLASSVPGVANTIRNVLVYLDAATNTIETVDGTAVPDVVGIPVPKPVLPDNGIAAAYVQLANGQTAVTTATHVIDAREFLEPRLSISSLLEATEVGQILISNDGVTFEPGVPMVDNNGDILTDENGFIVVT